jgi:hypothetical protein
MHDVCLLNPTKEAAKASSVDILCSLLAESTLINAELQPTTCYLLDHLWLAGSCSS